MLDTDDTHAALPDLVSFTNERTLADIVRNGVVLHQLEKMNAYCERSSRILKENYAITMHWVRSLSFIGRLPWEWNAVRAIFNW